jgi:hypothetical protein
MAAMAEQYPEHEKLKGLGGANQIVGDFIEWLAERRIELAEWNPSGTYCMPIHRSRDDLLAEFFEIDRDKLEAEKRAMLASLREPADG